MIYQFRSKAGPDVIMMADLTKRIFDILGRSLEPRGILTVEKLPALITALETAILQDLEDRSKAKSETEAGVDKPKLADRLGQRAYPFLELMKQAKALQARLDATEMVHCAKFSFNPIHGKIYFLYYDERNQTNVLIQNGPKNWSCGIPDGWIYSMAVKKLGDSTWAVVEEDEL